jgi:hypothetical protein
MEDAAPAHAAPALPAAPARVFSVEELEVHVRALQRLGAPPASVCWNARAAAWLRWTLEHAAARAAVDAERAGAPAQRAVPVLAPAAVSASGRG